MTQSLLEVRVANKVPEATDISVFELVAADGGKLPPFTAGAHIDVHIRDGLVRQYSLCNDPQERHRYLIGVLRDPASRGGSNALHDEIQEGDRLRISSPRNLFPLADHPRRSLLLAGGIGVTPILSMARQLSRLNAEFEMHYCTRSSARTAFRDPIRQSAFGERVFFHFDDGPASQRLDIPALLAAPAADLDLYVCGPAGFLETVLATARAQGWAESRIHFEYFSAEVQGSEDDAPFEVRLASSGDVIAVQPGQSVVDALAAQGVEIPISCQQGVCGSCLTRVLDGEPDHRDQYLTPAEQAQNDQFTPCCSRSKSPLLVLDL